MPDSIGARPSTAAMASSICQRPDSRETAARHCAGQGDLVLVAFAEDGLANLKWEPSRGGALFPHVYCSIPVSAAAWVKDLALKDGIHRFPEGLGA